MWWTTIAISVAAAYFEWTYRKKKKLSSESEEAQKLPDPKPVISENAGAAQREVS
jgi:hypothetical protein